MQKFHDNLTASLCPLPLPETANQGYVNYRRVFGANQGGPIPRLREGRVLSQSERLQRGLLSLTLYVTMAFPFFGFISFRGLPPNSIYRSRVREPALDDAEAGTNWLTAHRRDSQVVDDRPQPGGVYSATLIIARRRKGNHPNTSPNALLCTQIC